MIVIIPVLLKTVNNDRIQIPLFRLIKKKLYYYTYRISNNYTKSMKEAT